MNKELKALEKITNKLSSTKANGYWEDLDIIEAALKRLEQIDNATIGVYEEVNKKLRALELIKEILPIEEKDFFYDKETDIYFFIGYKVSKEIYNFLKEVLL